LPQDDLLTLGEKLLEINRPLLDEALALETAEGAVLADHRARGQDHPSSAGVRPKDGGFLRNKDLPFECDLLVLDEVSMVDAAGLGSQGPARYEGPADRLPVRFVSTYARSSFSTVSTTAASGFGTRYTVNVPFLCPWLQISLRLRGINLASSFAKSL
jgi:hypothetical protein